MYLEARPRQRGFTLIEAMVVVAVIALLAMVALPAYQGSVRKAHRTEAKAALSTAAQMMERYLTEKGTYATATLGAGGVYPDHSENNYYALSLPAVDLTATTFTLMAEGRGTQTADECGSFTLTQSGVRGVQGGSLTAADCW